MSAIDFTGITSPFCPNCGDAKFKTWIIVDEMYEIGIYATDGECFECGTKYSIVIPSDYIDDSKGGEE